MSEVIEQYIRAHRGQTENEAFEGFAQQDRIRAWLGSDASRRERLRREFARVWSQMDAQATSGGQTLAPPRSQAAHAPPTTAAPAHMQPPAHAPAPTPVAARAPAPLTISPGVRRLNLLCPTCERLEVYTDAGHIACRHCGRAYDNMLELVPVKAVGPFAFLFGEGKEGWLTAGGLALLILILYGVLKWA